MQTETTTRFRVLGVNDDRSHCECCGRQGLKRVVWIEDREAGTVKHFGTTCALSPVKGFGVDRDIKRAIADERRLVQNAYCITHDAYRRAGGKYAALPCGKAWTPVDRPLFDAQFAEAMQKMRRHATA
jgi:hypothetical protein